MTDRIGEAGAVPRPTLRGARVTIRPGDPDDVAPLRAVLAEASVTRWWGEPQSADRIARKLRGDGSGVLLVVEIGGRVAGGIQYHEEQDPQYRHAGIDIFLGGRYQGQALVRRRSACWPGSCSSGAAITGSPSIRRQPTSGRPAAIRRWVSGRWA
jgi:hypothetical protein